MGDQVNLEKVSTGGHGAVYAPLTPLVCGSEKSQVCLWRRSGSCFQNPVVNWALWSVLGG